MSKVTNPKISTVAMTVMFIAMILYTLIFWWYARTVVPHTYPTDFNTFFWGLMHGLFIVPTFIWSLFAHGVTIYQFPNDGHWYNLGFFIGISVILGGSHGARTKSRRRRSANERV